MSDVEDERGVEFAPALRGAIAAQGASLDQLRQALAEYGITVSVATLSYWQSGRSRPQRAASLAAIGPLEECLELPRGFLASRLPSMATVDPDRYGQARLPADIGESRAEQAAANLGMSYQDLVWVTIHDRHHIDAQRQERAQEVRLLLQARRDGVDRVPVWFETTDTTAIPLIAPVTNCSLGRVRRFPDFGGAVAELCLERPLRAGETTLVEHRQSTVGAHTPRQTVWRRVCSPSREVVIEVQFDPDVLPTSAAASEHRGADVTTRELAVYRTIQAHFTDNPAGRYEIGWHWLDGGCLLDG